MRFSPAAVPSTTDMRHFGLDIAPPAIWSDLVHGWEVDHREVPELSPPMHGIRQDWQLPVFSVFARIIPWRASGLGSSSIPVHLAFIAAELAAPNACIFPGRIAMEPKDNPASSKWMWMPISQGPVFTSGERGSWTATFSGSTRARERRCISMPRSMWPAWSWTGRAFCRWMAQQRFLAEGDFFYVPKGAARKLRSAGGPFAILSFHAPASPPDT